MELGVIDFKVNPRVEICGGKGGTCPTDLFNSQNFYMYFCKNIQVLSLSIPVEFLIFQVLCGIFNKIQGMPYLIIKVLVTPL